MRYKIRKCACGYWTVQEEGLAIYRGQYGRVLAELRTLSEAGDYARRQLAVGGRA